MLGSCSRATSSLRSKIVNGNCQCGFSNTHITVHEDECLHHIPSGRWKTHFVRVDENVRKAPAIWCFRRGYASFDSAASAAKFDAGSCDHDVVCFTLDDAAIHRQPRCEHCFS